ncbi:MAG TPA: hypothetical protein VJX23_16895 [Candidatus Binataceae bacterium]|nr:hypothetical protein [Candidatus Binataceae bacterium]
MTLFATTASAQNCDSAELFTMTSIRMIVGKPMAKTNLLFKVTDPADDDPPRVFVRRQPAITPASGSGNVQRAAPRTAIYEVKPGRFDN